MLSQIQRFGGAMFTPVLLFPFAGIVVGLAILLQNPMFVGESLTDPTVYSRKSYTLLKRAVGRYSVICR